MKRLTLLRHAKSSWDDEIQRDFDRPLNKRGRRAAATIGREMKRLGLEFDQVIASPAARVRGTLDEVAAGYGAELSPQFNERVYLASPEALLDIVQAADEDATSLLVVGHNPGLEQLAAMLTAEFGALRAELDCKYPTATLAEIEIDVDRWAEISEAGGTLTRFVRPRDLDPELGPED